MAGKLKFSLYVTVYTGDREDHQKYQHVDLYFTSSTEDFLFRIQLKLGKYGR